MLPQNLTEAQQRSLAEHVWLHFSQMSHFSSTNARPTVLVRGEGSRVWDQEGNAYIDGLSGLFTVNAGYGRREIVEAVTAQMEQLVYVSPFSFPSLPMIDLSARLAAIAPTGPDSRVFLTTGGSDAVETALKMAKAYQRRKGHSDRTKVVGRRVAYHGTSMGALSVNGLTSVRNGFGPLVPGARHAPLPYRYRCDYCALERACKGTCADEVERLIQFEGPETVAAVIMEPVQNSGGAIVSPPGYLQRVREICDRYGILMIVDEVICGFGRVGGWFGSSEMGVTPDIITCAKALTSGYMPLGAAIAGKHVADTFMGDEGDKFVHGITFGGHAAACAAAIANLDIIEREGLTGRSRTMGDYMIRELRAAVGDHPNVGEIRGMGLFMAVELVRDRDSRASLEGEEHLMGWLSDQLKRRGLICRADDRLEPVIQLAPPLVLTREEADQCVAVVAEVIHALGRKLGSVSAPQAPPLSVVGQSLAAD